MRGQCGCTSAPSWTVRYALTSVSVRVYEHALLVTHARVSCTAPLASFRGWCAVQGVSGLAGPAFMLGPGYALSPSPSPTDQGRDGPAGGTGGGDSKAGSMLAVLGPSGAGKVRAVGAARAASSDWAMVV